uniref:Reverse transcriptase/retrotransposon-derived protein RNase H-like domain-containing protein n=1 Tax=Moschus moschiferus TaxID=68415 RepID=A0A8C6E7V2_MOSMO
ASFSVNLDSFPLYKLIAETQQAQTNTLVWSPDTQKAFKVLQTALLQAPTLSLPTGSEFNLFVTERKGMALGVLTQLRGPHQQPIAYLSRELDAISRGWPHCLRRIRAVALLAPEALKILNGQTILY